jgi:hypothetical protein
MEIVAAFAWRGAAIALIPIIVLAGIWLVFWALDH